MPPSILMLKYAAEAALHPVQDKQTQNDVKRDFFLPFNQFVKWVENTHRDQTQITSEA